MSNDAYKPKLLMVMNPCGLEKYNTRYCVEVNKLEHHTNHLPYGSNNMLSMPVTDISVSSTNMGGLGRFFLICVLEWF